MFGISLSREILKVLKYVGRYQSITKAGKVVFFQYTAFSLIAYLQSQQAREKNFILFDLFLNTN